MNPYRPGPSRSRGLADRMERRPLTARLVLMVVAFLLLIPIAGIIRGSGTNVVRSGGLPGAAVGADPLVSATTAEAVAGPAPSSSASSSAATFVPASSASSTSAPAAASVASGDLSAASTAAPTTAAKRTTTTPATTAAKKTTRTTTATTAAKKAPATTAATKSTSPPSTKAPATTAASSPPKTQPTTTTTAAAAPAPPPNSYSKAQVEAIIRSVWPADQADEAVRIAKRESNLVPTVRNWCCYGLFQIYFKMNQPALAAVGVTSPEQLYDPRVNAEAAYAMYQRSGWAPWGQ
jgi:hypothetical protein